MGARLAKADKASRPFCIWKTDRLAREGKKACFFNECTPSCKQATLPFYHKSTHMTKSVVAGPELLGHPAPRRRALAFCFDRRQLVWAGPEDHERDFFELFQAPWFATLLL